MKGKDFEALVLFRARKLEEERVLTIGRYGVQAVMMNDPQTGKPGWQVIPSLPDFEGVIFGSGRQLIIEAKVCSQASYPLYATHAKRPKQIDHMLLRSRFGSLCYLLVHFPERQLKTRTDPEQTIALRVHQDEPIWREYENCDRRSLTRDDMAMYGITIPWNLYSSRASKPTPDLTFLLPEKPALQLSGEQQ